MRRWFTWPKLIVYALLVILFAAWYVPRISAAGYREPIRAALENALNRKVEIGLVQFQLLPMPGFTIENVTIGEDPSIGAEPIAYVDTLRARPRVSALFGGPLEFASVDLEGASLNLTRVGSTDAGIRWNFSSLLKPKLLATFPSVHMAGGRINFKFGDTKSIFYLLNTDVDLWPPGRADEPWTLRVHAEPARTDRPSRGFGSFIGRGQYRPRDGAVTLDVRMEKSELGDMITLVRGAESGVHGHIWGDAHLAGPLSRLGVAGRVTIDDIHGWNQNPPPGTVAWPLAVSGSIDLPGQVIDVRAVSSTRQFPVDLRYRVSRYLAQPQWGVTAILNGTPLAPFAPVGRSLGWNLPADLPLEGTMQGAVGYSVASKDPRVDGEVKVVNAAWGALRVPEADLRFAGSSVSLAPTAMTNAAGETANVEGTFDIQTGAVSATVLSDGMSVASLRRPVAVFSAPLLPQPTSGTWSGVLHYNSGVWDGSFRLTDADVPFEAFAQPLHVLSADTEIDAAGVSMKRLNLTVGGLPAQGEYRYEFGAARPHRFRVVLARADAAAIEKLLMPTLHRGNFLNYAFNFGRVPEPDWLRNMHADGTLQAASLSVAGNTFSKVKTRVIWDGDRVTLSALQAQLLTATFNGSGAVNLAQREPRYRVSGRLAGISWRSGTVEGEGTISSFGTGAELLSNLTAQGAVKGRHIELARQETWDSVNGCFDGAWNGGAKLKLTQLVLTSGGVAYIGQAETEPNGQLLLDVSDGTRQIRTGLNLIGP